MSIERSGERIPVKFEILADCSFDRVLGEDIVWDHVDAYEEAIEIVSNASTVADLAPFSFMNTWEGRASEWSGRKISHREQQEDRHCTDGDLQTLAEEIYSDAPDQAEQHREHDNFLRHQTEGLPRTNKTRRALEAKERRRRDQWYYLYGFDGIKASVRERHDEAARRRSFEDKISRLAKGVQ